MLHSSLPGAVEQHTCVTEEAVNKTRQRKQDGKCSRESHGFEELMRKSSLCCVARLATSLLLSFVCWLFGLWCNRSKKKRVQYWQVEGGHVATYHSRVRQSSINKLILFCSCIPGQGQQSNFMVQASRSCRLAQLWNVNELIGAVMQHVTLGTRSLKVPRYVKFTLPLFSNSNVCLYQKTNYLNGNFLQRANTSRTDLPL